MFPHSQHFTALAITVGLLPSECRSSATIITDEWAAYRGLGDEFDGGHHTVNHSLKEYVRHTDGNDAPEVVSTNTAESWFALLKRAHYGIHHKMSKKHLHRYCVERSFVWNNREVTDGERMVAAMKGAEGKRLMYVQSGSQSAG